MKLGKWTQKHILGNSGKARFTRGGLGGRGVGEKATQCLKKSPITGKKVEFRKKEKASAE